MSISMSRGHKNKVKLDGRGCSHADTDNYKNQLKIRKLPFIKCTKC